MTAPHAEAPVTVRTFAHRFSATPRGARLARLLAAHQLIDWDVHRGTRAFDAATLVVGELAANAVLHGRVPGRDCALRLAHDTGAGTVRIEVSDAHPGRPLRPVGAELASEDDHGRGLALVEAVTVRWGVQDRSGPGKTVWAECAVEAPSAGTFTVAVAADGDGGAGAGGAGRSAAGMAPPAQEPT